MTTSGQVKNQIVKPDEGTVFAEVYLQKRNQWLWIVRNCPYCHKLHIHGGGGLNENPRDYLGWRLSHCIPGIAGKGSKPYQYYLKEINNDKEESKKTGRPAEKKEGG